jgi:hypothetical protein
MQGFQDDAVATAMANAVASYIRSISRYINLERLDGVTVAHDYDDALLGLDRGVEGLRPLTRSNDDQLVGVAMAPAVLRDGAVKVHMVFNAHYLHGLEETEDGEEGVGFSDTLYLLAHECAHVEVTTEKDRAFPGRILQANYSDYVEAFFAPIVEACWEEYAACRLSAMFGAQQLERYEEGLIGVLGVSATKSETARTSFWQHNDLDRAALEIAAPLLEPMRIASYAYGHLDGLDDQACLSDEAQIAIDQAGFRPFLDDLVAALRRLWSLGPDWDDEAQFDIVADVARDVLWYGGLLVSPTDGESANINVWEPNLLDPHDLGLERYW